MADSTVKPSGGDFTTRASALSDAATRAGHTITIIASGDARHAGLDNEGSNYELAVSAAHCIVVNNTGCVIDGIIVKQDGTGSSDEGIRFADNSTLTVKNTIIWADTQDTNQDGFRSNETGDITVNFEQVYIYGFSRGGYNGNHAAPPNDPTRTHNLNSCGFWNNGHEDSTSAGGVNIHSNHSSATITANLFNCWSLGNDGHASAEDYSEKLVSSGTVTWNISHCIDSDNSIVAVLDAGGTNLASRTLRDATAGGNEVLVQDITTAPYDLTLIDDATNNDAQDVHTVDTVHGLTIPSTDIAGTSRPQNTSHDIGSFEIVVVAAAEDEDAGLFTPGQHQPIIKLPTMTPY